MSIYTCPHCGSNSYEEMYSESTAIYSPKLVLEGQYHFHDPNIHTTHCTCLKCHHKFDVKEQEGKILDIIDCGETLKVPTINEDITSYTVEPIATKYVPMETTVSIAHIDKEGNPLREKTQVEKDIEKLRDEVSNLKEEISDLRKALIAAIGFLR